MVFGNIHDGTYKLNKIKYHIGTEWHLLGCVRRVALVRTDVSEELSASFIRVTRIG
jgi:hypothetical protein